MKILIGMPSYSGLIPSMVVTSLLRLESPYPVGFQIVTRRMINSARNIIALAALKKGYDYLLFIDDDNPIPPDTIVKLLEDDKDIVTAPILGRKTDEEDNYTLCAFYGKYHDGTRFYTPITQFRDEGYLHGIDSCGMGCTLIKREVLIALYEKYKDFMFEFGDIRFDTPIQVGTRSYGRRTMSEDMEFTERAVDAGFEIWLDDRIRPLHLIRANTVQWEERGN